MTHNGGVGSASDSIVILSVTIVTVLIGIGFNASYADYGVSSEMGGAISSNLGIQNGSSAGANSSASANITSQVGESPSSPASATSQASEANVQTSSGEISQEHYMNSYQMMESSSDNEVTAQSDKHLYMPGDQVSLAGSIWRGLYDTLSGVSSVTVQVTDSSGNVVYTGKGQVRPDRTFSAQFQLPPEAKEGVYQVDIKPDISADILKLLTANTQVSLKGSGKFVVASPNLVIVQSGNKDYQVEIATNSSAVYNIKYDDEAKMLSFRVQGQTGTKGVTEVTIPKSVMNGDLTVMMDGQAMAKSDVVETVNTNDQTTLEINYHHSAHTIDIVETSPVPEFPVIPVVLAISTGIMILFHGIRPRV